ncbi:MAG: hypothetical protein WKF79_00135 [Nocardioides sp.]
MTQQADRDRMIAETVRAGVPRSDASEIVDLGAHACEQAMDAARRVADTASPGNRLPVFVSVLASMATLMREDFPDQWEAFLEANPPSGRSTVIIASDLTGEAGQ